MKINKVLGILAILGFLSTATFAEDFLAKVTNGAVSDTSEGVRLLSTEEEREVVGGYMSYSAGWYSQTIIKSPYTNNYNANIKPQTNNQKFYSNAFIKTYKPLRFFW